MSHISKWVSILDSMKIVTHQFSRNSVDLLRELMIFIFIQRCQDRRRHTIKDMRNATTPSLQCLAHHNHPRLQVGIAINCRISTFYCIFFRASHIMPSILSLCIPEHIRIHVLRQLVTSSNLGFSFTLVSSITQSHHCLSL